MGMTPDQRETYVLRELLRVLRDCGGYFVPVETLYIQANITIRPVLTRYEFKIALGELEAKGYIQAFNRELSGLQYRITDLGRAVLAEAEG